MSRKRIGVRVAAIYSATRLWPGIRMAEIAVRLGLHRSDVARALPELERRRLLLWEDDSGRLYPFF